MKNKKIRTRRIIGDPKGTRTPDSAVRGLRLNHLTMGPNYKHENYSTHEF